MKAFLPALIWALVILGLSIMPSINLPKTFWEELGPDKIAHIIVYCILALALQYGYHKQGKLNNRTKWIAVGVSGLYGISMEIIQFAFFPGRYFELYDIVANIIGALLSLWAFKFLVKN